MICEARVVPLKPIKIPCLELNAAVVSINISSLIQQELNISNVVEYKNLS